jgi:putative dimethyl sulfoxide reductase chaperone
MTATDDTVEISDLIKGRIGFYDLLSRMFLVEIDQPLLDNLRQADFVVTVDNADLNEGYALWCEFQKRVDEGTLVNLAVDYVRAFIGTGRDGDGAAYPYESIYTSPEHLIMQDSRDEVLALYRSEGMGKDDSFTEPEDHVALELSFMAHLNRRALELFESGSEREGIDYLNKQKAFLDGHLLNWVPAFCDNIAKFAQEPLYLGLAKVTRGFLAVDKAVLDDLLVDLAETVG